jgi:hypothetical protein
MASCSVWTKKAALEHATRAGRDFIHDPRLTKRKSKAKA